MAKRFVLDDDNSSAETSNPRSLQAFRTKSKSE